MLSYSFYCIMFMLYLVVSADITTEETHFLNELSLDKLLMLKNALHDLTTVEYTNTSERTPVHLEKFGAQALAIKAPPIKRTDYEEGLHKYEGISKISNIFSMSVTTLAFLAFGGYLLCLIVQAVKSKQSMNTAVLPQSPFIVNAGIKRPQTHFASYGRRKRATAKSNDIELPPDELFYALLELCEGYAKWSKQNEYT